MFRVGGRGRRPSPLGHHSHFLPSAVISTSRISRGRVSLCSTSPVHPSHCSSTRHILRSVLFSHVCFYASDYIYHIRLYYAPSLVPTYVLRSGVEFFAAGEWCGWWFWDGGCAVVGVVWWCGVGGWGWVCLCSFDFVWHHVLCQTSLVLPIL
ncbi:hypothetical protein BDR06DRAFT_664061 [Suillus hirtellus]|nr:hypothetical protein BDR06DRAFT_664061 [Suillus hirtellus]